MALPYKDQEGNKKKQVEQMFDSISPKYDLLNHLLSGGIDIYWRKRAIKELKNQPIDLLLDMATGTGDFAIEALKLNPKKIIGMDISDGMLSFGRKKIKEMNMENKIEFIQADSEKIPLEDNSVDAITVSFGVRNFENLALGLKELNRVLKPNGKCVIVEFSNPKKFPMKQLYWFYAKKILPIFGKLISGDPSAYTYLPESVAEFPDGQNFLSIYEKAGFIQVKCITMTGGICSIYTGTK